MPDSGFFIGLFGACQRFDDRYEIIRAYACTTHKRSVHICNGKDFIRV
jgi:hypothetical protein